MQIQFNATFNSSLDPSTTYTTAILKQEIERALNFTLEDTKTTTNNNNSNHATASEDELEEKKETKRGRKEKQQPIAKKTKNSMASEEANTEKMLSVTEIGFNKYGF